MPGEFLTPTFKGKRFDSHSLPLEVAKDLSALQDLISAVAKQMYLTDNPSRQRVPRGFDTDFQLAIEKIEAGSVKPVLSLFVAGALLLGGDSDGYFGKARDVVVECIHSGDQSVPDQFPLEYLNYFNRVGSSLREDESIEFPRKAGGVATLTQAKRRALVLKASASYQKKVSLRGYIDEVDYKTKTFRLVEKSGTSIRVPFDSSFEDQARDNGNKTRNQISIRCVAEFDEQERLRSVVSVDSMDVLPNFQILKFIDGVKTLEDGWLDGEGKRFEAEKVDDLGFMLSRIFPEDLEMPIMAPTGSGKLFLEWSSTQCPSIEIDVETMSGEFHAFGSNGIDVEAILDVSTERGWEVLFDLARKNGARASS